MIKPLRIVEAETVQTIDPKRLTLQEILKNVA